MINPIIFWLMAIYFGAVLFGHMIYGKALGWPVKSGLSLGLLRAAAPIIILILSSTISYMMVGAINGHMSWYDHLGEYSNQNNEHAFIVIEEMCFAVSLTIFFLMGYLPLYKKMKDDWGFFPEKNC